MWLQQKLQVAKSFLDGSRSVTDQRLFWSRPRAWVGGELVNKAGLQIARAAYQHIKHRPSLEGVAPERRELAEALINDGMIVLPDFLPQEIFEKVRAEYHAAFAPGRDTINRQSDNTVNRPSHKFTSDSDAITSAVIRGVQQDSCKLTEALSPTALQHVVRNPVLWELVAAAVGKRVKYQPGAFFQREKRAADRLTDTEQNIILHEDVFYHSIKAFYYINDNTVENGAFVVVPKTQRLDRRRLKHEYLFCVDIALQKKGRSFSHPLHESGRMEVHGRAYSKEDLKEVQVVGQANTLIVADTMAFHRRGGSSPVNERQQIRMCFRHVETLHHLLYPRFGTTRSKRYQDTAYY